MALLSIGLTPISPVMWVVPVVEIPDFDRITKLLAVPRFTGSRAAAVVVVELELDVVVAVAEVVGLVVEVDCDVVELEVEVEPVVEVEELDALDACEDVLLLVELDVPPALFSVMA
jgi:hypothetical protein